MGRVFLRLLVGGTAGLLAWALMEPIAPKQFFDPRWADWSLKFVALIGALVGLAVGGLDGYYLGSRLKTIRGLALGLIFGAIGGTFGFGLGGRIADSVFGNTGTVSGPMATQMLARVIGFVFMGIFLGFGIGLSSLSFRKGVQGMVGGGIGAAIAGLLFDPVSAIVGPALLAMRGGDEVGIIGRVILSVIQGALIGLFIGIVERVSRSAWVRLTLGRNEGKEWVIDAAQTMIGRSEGAGIPLFGDMNIAPQHACIIRQGPNQYLLADGGSPIGTLLNGQRIQQAPLMPGSIITIGGFNLEFLTKNQPAPVRGPEAYPGQAYAIGGQGYSQPIPQQPTAPQYPTGQMQPQSQPVTQMAPLGSPATYTLVAMDGPLTGQRFPISGPTDVGREQPAIPMSFDSQASRRHAQVIPDAMGLNVVDLNSTNGTFVNGQRVQSQTVRSGDLVKIGATTFRVD
jgi:pSer/pThr/pTyr-binding forkhead associated (FHA) protein